MVLKLSAKDRHAAATSSPSYDLHAGGRAPNIRRKFDTVADPDILLHNGQTLRQGRLPTLLSRLGVLEAQSGHAPPISDEDQAQEGFTDPDPASHEPDIVFFESSPPPDPGKHQRKRSYTVATLAARGPAEAAARVSTAAGRDQVSSWNWKDGAPKSRLVPATKRGIELRWCISPISPNNTAFSTTLERVLANMGFQLDHQNSLRRRFGNCLMWYTHLRNLLKKKYTVMLEAIRRLLHLADVPASERRVVVPGRRRHLVHLHRRHPPRLDKEAALIRPPPLMDAQAVENRLPPLQDVTEMKTRPPPLLADAQAVENRLPPLQDVEEMETRPPPLLADAQAVENRLPPLQDVEEMATRPPPLADGQAVESRLPPLADGQAVESRLPPLADGQAVESRLPPLADGQAVESRLPPLADANVVESRHLSHRKYHFLNRLLDCDPANTSAGRCPACFGNLKHDPSEILHRRLLHAEEEEVSARSSQNTPRIRTSFRKNNVRERKNTSDGVRGTSGEQTERERKRPAVQEVDEEDGYEYARLPLPRSVLDACEASFKAADEKRQKTSTDFFDDTALMALLCRHDRVLFVANMHSAGEKQFYVIALVETFFQHLPLEIWVGLMYDVACSAERSCLKWGFLARYMDRIAFAVSVFHAFGHEWACQLLYHPRKRSGFGLSNGEGAERFWKSISHLIAHLRICGYHNRLYTLDAQIEHADQQSLLRLGEWINRRYRHSLLKRAEAEEELRKCGKPTELLREQWSLQVQAQTRPLPRRAKNRGEKAVNAVMLLRSAIKTREAQVEECRKKFLDAVVEEDEDAGLYEAEYDASKEALVKAQSSLRRKEQALGVDEQAELKSLAKSEYMRLRMNARALKLRLRERLRARKFELDVVERSYRRLVNAAKLHAHTESAVKRREPTISKLATEYNKLCKQIDTLIRAKKAPRKAIAPLPIPREGLWQLDVDDAIFQDVGLDDHDDDYHDHPPLWLCDEKVRTGIKAMLDLDRCDEEDARLRRETLALRAWFAEEWQISTVAIEVAASGVDEYHLQLHQDKLVQLCATWDRCLPDFGPGMGGEDRHYGKKKRSAKNEEEEEEEEAESGDEEEDFGTLEAAERADIYQVPSDRTVTISSGTIPVSSWTRVDNYRTAFHGYLAKDRTTDSPFPRISFPEFPERIYAPPTTAPELAQHKMRLRQEDDRRRELNQRVTEAKQAAEADNDDKGKALLYENLLDEYETAFGDYIDDSEAHEHVIKRRQRMVRLDELWTVAKTKGCPISNPAPLEAYLDAAFHFHADFKHPYERDDGQTAALTLSCRVLERYKKLLEYCKGKRGELNRLVGQDTFIITFVNPYQSFDSRRKELDTQMRKLVRSYAFDFKFQPQETLHLAEVKFRVSNRHKSRPESVKCRRLYCGVRLLAEDLEELQNDAEKTARRFPVTLKPVSSSTFYNVMHSLRAD
ncbi:hypothetical protein MSAN_01120600 [Mycena sanguinolenta]|uniref:C2H2-type domain-containing protein n=1 Tax=Mycena sanguinolenta TaxID=230812 RepID=A0A8H6YLN8_9AGAR|nr:hypothetical protein MSAN_01120600 [Mycena sanguinolenta]